MTGSCSPGVRLRDPGRSRRFRLCGCSRSKLGFARLHSAQRPAEPEENQETSAAAPARSAPGFGFFLQENCVKTVTELKHRGRGNTPESRFEDRPTSEEQRRAMSSAGNLSKAAGRFLQLRAAAGRLTG